MHVFIRRNNIVKNHQLMSAFISYSLNAHWQKTTGAKTTGKICSLWLHLAQAEWKSKRVFCFEKINWVRNRVYHENRPHWSSKFRSFSRSRLFSIPSKYSSVILALKCVLFPCTNSFLDVFSGPVCLILRNIDGYTFPHSTPWHSSERLPRRPFATEISVKQMPINQFPS